MRNTIRVPTLLSWLGVVVLFLTSIEHAAAAIHRVKPGAPGANDGTSWTDAFTNLNSALKIAVAGDEVWVAVGYHRAPTTTLVDPQTPLFGGGYTSPFVNRMVAFVFPAGVAIRGSFAGTESAPVERDFAVYPSILLGACLDGKVAELVYKSEADLLEDFVIDGAGVSGGGLFGAVTRNCIFRNCRSQFRSKDGSATVYDHYMGSAFSTTGRVQRCIFQNNISTFGPAVLASRAELVECQIIGNRNLGDTLGSAIGGGIIAWDARLESCLVARNRIEAASVPGASWGGGFYGDVCQLVNCSIANNTVIHPVSGAGQGGGAFLAGSIRNSIVWGNAASVGPQIFADPPIPASHTLVQGGYPGTAMLELDPQFASAGTGDFRLTAGSPAREAGSLDELVLLSDRDLDGKLRLIDADGDGQPVIDLGAYEFGNYAQFLGITLDPGQGTRLEVETSLNSGLRVEVSSNWVDWLDIGSPSASGGVLIFRDQSLPVSGNRFYRFVAP